jgi:hypothetical protein
MARSRILLPFGLLALAAGPALAQQRVNPVTINPNPSNGAVINYGTNYFYGAPGVYGGFPGVYGAPAVVAPGAYGVVSPGYGFNVGPFGYGDNAWSDPIGRQQQYALANSRYDLQNAQANEAYAKANFFQQAAIATALQNQNAGQAPEIRERYNARTARPKGAARAPKADAPLSLDKLMTRQGAILWPDKAPKNDARAAVDEAIAKLAQQFATDGKADVQDVNAARDALHAYGQPALNKLRKDHPTLSPAFRTFLNSLDATLVGWAK